MALASKILQRVIVTPTATQIRGATLLAGAFADTGLLLPADLSCANLATTGIIAGSAAILALTLAGQAIPPNGLIVSFLTPEIDFLVTGPIAVPGTTRAGFTFAPTGAHFICSAAVAVTVAPVVKAGNDGPRTNILSSQSFPSVGQFTIGKNSVNNESLAAKPVAMVDLATPITLEVVTAATATAAKGYMRIFGFLNTLVT